jgi:hypothetical protein
VRPAPQVSEHPPQSAPRCLRIAPIAQRHGSPWDHLGTPWPQPVEQARPPPHLQMSPCASRHLPPPAFCLPSKPTLRLVDWRKNMQALRLPSFYEITFAGPGTGRGDRHLKVSGWRPRRRIAGIISVRCPGQSPILGASTAGIHTLSNSLLLGAGLLCRGASWRAVSRHRGRFLLRLFQHGVPLGVLVVAQFRGRPPRLALSVAR